MRMLLLCLSITGLFAAGTSRAATPPSGTLSDASQIASWSGAVMVSSGSTSGCGGPSNSACDNYTLTIQAPGYAYQVVIVLTQAQAAEWDLEVYDPAGHKVGSSYNTGTPQTVTLYDPPGGAYTVAVSPLAPVPLPSGHGYDASATLSACAACTATAQLGVNPPTHQVPVVVGVKGNEPQIVVDSAGTEFIGALNFLYVSTDHGLTWTPSPGTPFSNNPNSGDPASSGINDVSDSTLDIDPDNRLYFAVNYPYAGSVAVCASDDQAQTFTCDPAANPGANDRQWVVAPAAGEAYLTTNQGLYETVFLASQDSGTTFVPTKTGDLTALEPQLGPMVTNPIDHRLYQALNTSSEGLGIFIWDQHSINTGPEAKLPAGLGTSVAMPNVAITRDGALYVVTDAGGAVRAARSADFGNTWATLAPVPAPTGGASTFPWIASGGSAGHIGMIFYHTSSGLGDANAHWDVYWAETWQADQATPTWFVHRIDHDVHTGNICAALSCSGNDRFAGDFIGATFDADDEPHVVWMAQRTDATGTLVTEIRTLASDRIFGDVDDGFGVHQ